MADEDNIPVLLSCKAMSSEYKEFKKIALTSEKFTLGRGLNNSVVIPCLSISRNHCLFTKTEGNKWLIIDYSTFGIQINNEKMEKGASKTLSDADIIYLEPTGEFVYKFVTFHSDDFKIPRKRLKIENQGNNCTLDDVKNKFEQSQHEEIKHIEEKINSTKQLHTTSIILKQQLQVDMERKIKQLQSGYAEQIENLEGENEQVKKQKALLIKERDMQLAQVKNEMEGKIADLMEQIQKHNETESELLKENNLLKENLAKEREEFLSELSRESSSKQDMLDKLEAKIREQEEVRLKEKQELEETLRKETEQLVLAKQNELKELSEQKRLRELELEQQLENIKKSLTKQMEESEKERLDVEKKLNLQLEEMKKLSHEEKIKSEQLQKERENIQKQLIEAQKNSTKYIEEMQQHVTKRETELAALAADRINQQAELSSGTITTLQSQLESIQNQLHLVEREKSSLLENICDNAGEGASKQSALTEVGELMESELQCSICAELFIEAMTLNCSHTFCQYCITMWKKKKKDCPICRSSITAENRSLVLDTFIEKMVQNLTEEMKHKRQDILKSRAELVSEMARQTAGTSRRSFDFDESEYSDDEFLEEEEEEDYYQTSEYDYGFYHRRDYDESDTDSGSDDESSGDAAGDGGAGAASDAAAPVPAPSNQTVGLDQQGHPTLLIADGGADASRGFPAPTTAATGAASAAAPAATGPPAAPSDEHHAPPFPYIPQS